MSDSDWRVCAVKRGDHLEIVHEYDKRVRVRPRRVFPLTQQDRAELFVNGWNAAVRAIEPVNAVQDWRGA